MSRTEVTPQRSIDFKSPPDSAWTWASIKPGRIHFPSAETTRALAGSALTASGVAGPTETIRPSDTTRSESEIGADPEPSMSVAPRKAITAVNEVNPRKADS
jgi:hypothetical protein